MRDGRITEWIVQYRLNVWSRGKYLILSSRVSISFQRRSRGKRRHWGNTKLTISLRIDIKSFVQYSHRERNIQTTTLSNFISFNARNQMIHSHETSTCYCITAVNNCWIVYHAGYSEATWSLTSQWQSELNWGNRSCLINKERITLSPGYVNFFSSNKWKIQCFTSIFSDHRQVPNTKFEISNHWVTQFPTGLSHSVCASGCALPRWAFLNEPFSYCRYWTGTEVPSPCPFNVGLLLIVDLSAELGETTLGWEGRGGEGAREG